MKLVEMVPNFRDGRNRSIITVPENAVKEMRDAKLLDTEMDYDHNRSVITVVATLENAVYIELLRLKERISGIDIFYFSENSEIDFIITRNNITVQAIQVCYDLNAFNIDRERKPLIKFLDRYNHKEAIIIIMEKDNIRLNDSRIKVISFYEWVLFLNEGKNDKW